jgi:hypothetical protein
MTSTTHVQKIWNEGKAPPDWKKDLIVKFPQKGDPTIWQGTTLLSVPSKVFLRIVLGRMKMLQTYVRSSVRSKLHFFGIGVDLINTLRIILE